MCSKCAVLVLLSTSRLFRAKVDGILWIFTLNCFSLLSVFLYCWHKAMLLLFGV